MNKSAMNINVHVLWWTCVFIFLDKYIGVELLDHRVDALKKKKKKNLPTKGHKKTFRGDRCVLHIT